MVDVTRWPLIARVPALLAPAALLACGSSGWMAVDAAPTQRSSAVAVAESLAAAAVRNEQQLRADTLPARTVAVAPFAVEAADSTLAPLGDGLADLLMSDLAQSRQLTVVERLRLDALLRELELARSGRVDTATAPRVGRLVGARRLVVGAVAQPPGAQELVLEARVADAATSETRGAVSGRAAVARILDAEKALAMQLFAELGVTLTPAERAAVERNRTGNLAALLAYSRGVRAEVEWRYGDAVNAYREAGRLDPTFSAPNTRAEQVRAYTMVPTTSGAGAGVVPRAVAVTTERVNAGAIPPVGGLAPRTGLADPAYPAPTVRVVVTVTTPP
jgi:TolB-like protein